MADDVSAADSKASAFSPLGTAATLAGPLVFVATLVFDGPAGLTGEAWHAAGVAVWMACWWLAQPVPLAATALLPLVILPASGVSTITGTAAQYANPIIFLVLGGFMIALAIERSNLHRRLALALLLRLGGRPAVLVGGFMAVSACLSMWITNTASTLMLLPVGLSVLHVVDDRHHGPVAPALVLGIAYGASLGGMASLVGTPTNALTAALLTERYGLEIGFARWMLMALPLSLVMLALGWFLLTRVIFRLSPDAAPGARAAIRRQHAELGAMQRGEFRVAVIAMLTAACWVTRPLLAELPGLGWLSDAAIALTGAIILFLVPLDAERRALDWEATRNLPWGILILLGGGLALAEAIATSGLGEDIALFFHDVTVWPFLALVLLIVATMTFLTEVTSNTATAATVVPVVAAMAVSAGLDPVQLAIPATLAVSCAFMLPVATPPNAIVYGSGLVSASQMARAGIVFNLMAIGLISLTMPYAARLIFS